MSRGFLLRVLSQPPADGRVTEHRRAILHELGAVAPFRRDLEGLYVLSCRLRTALEGATVGKKLDPTRRQLDVLALIKEIFDRMSASFEGAGSGLAQLRALGAEVRATEAYRSMADLLDYDEHLATLSLSVRVGADGRVRGFDVTSLRERKENPFVLSPARRWLAKIEMLLRGYRFGDGEIMARLLDAVFEGVEDHVLALLPLVGEMEFYLGSLGFRELAEAAGLEVSLPELRAATDPEGPRVLLGLFNPLLVANGVRPIPCDLGRPIAPTPPCSSPAPTPAARPASSSRPRWRSSSARSAPTCRRARRAWSPSPGLVVSLIQETRFDQGEGRLGMELLRIRALFEELGPGAMVVLDELCSGTNPSEGEEIFELVISLLARLQPQAFITTHFLTFAGRLAREQAIQGLRFLQVELDPAQKPTYQFVAGVATTSLAGHAATRLGVTRDELDRLIDRNIAHPGERPRAFPDGRAS